MKNIQQPTFYLTDTITDEHIRFFQRHGIVQFKKFIDRATVADFLSEIKNVEEFLLKHDIRKVNGVPLRFGNDEMDLLLSNVSHLHPSLAMY